MPYLTLKDTVAIQAFTDECLATARDWRSKGRIAAELFCLDWFVQNRLRFALREASNVEAGVQHFLDSDTRYALGRVTNIIPTLFVARQVTPDDPPATSAFHLATHVHALWLSRDFVGAQQVAEAFALPDWPKRIMSGGLWTDYGNALWALITATPWRPRQLKRAGYSHHFYPYLELMSAWALNSDDSGARQRIRASFEKRNRDRRLFADLDGDGRLPVAWDFRLASLELFQSHQAPAA